ncbi:hypothetical protein MA16_Dca006233 [Dendrobium catenatum]|uniref:Uncharacterized protein n=1 Tax=Dendrobium catenatum TaxID=906689 RepID=A0A2I0W988_9ASPA|nr:hypothetical protein MA16_Dca006233 [Dendrobium catenatum]
MFFTSHPFSSCVFLLTPHYGWWETYSTNSGSSLRARIEPHFREAEDEAAYHRYKECGITVSRIINPAHISYPYPIPPDLPTLFYSNSSFSTLHSTRLHPRDEEPRGAEEEEAPAPPPIHDPVPLHLHSPFDQLIERFIDGRSALILTLLHRSNNILRILPATSSTTQRIYPVLIAALLTSSSSMTRTSPGLMLSLLRLPATFSSHLHHLHLMIRESKIGQTIEASSGLRRFRVESVSATNFPPLLPFNIDISSPQIEKLPSVSPLAPTARWRSPYKISSTFPGEAESLGSDGYYRNKTHAPDSLLSKEASIWLGILTCEPHWETFVSGTAFFLVVLHISA